jgi:hypothetical protein
MRLLGAVVLMVAEMAIATALLVVAPAPAGASGSRTSSHSFSREVAADGLPLLSGRNAPWTTPRHPHL